MFEDGHKTIINELIKRNTMINRRNDIFIDEFERRITKFAPQTLKLYEEMHKDFIDSNEEAVLHSKHAQFFGLQCELTCSSPVE